MRVVTFNIRHGAAPGRFSDIDRLAAVVQSLNGDVVALQEVDKRVFRSGFSDQAARIAEACGLVPVFGRARRIGPLSGYGNALLTPSEPKKVEVLELRSIGEQRVAVIADLDLPDGPATFVSVHLQNRKRGRPEQALSQLDQLLNVMSCRSNPVVIMGDFNLRPDVVVPRLRLAGMTASGGEPTFPSDAPRLVIDWVAVKGFEIINSTVPDVTVSDHRPIVADLRRCGSSQDRAREHPRPNFDAQPAEG